MRRSLHSFTFFIKERKRTLRSFWFHKSYKNCNSRKKKNIKECSVLFIRLKKSFNVLFSIYIYIYMYLYIFIYIYIYILKKERNVLRSFAKERKILAVFYVLCKRMLHSLRSFMFFAKECCVLCVLLRSLQKNIAFFAFFWVS